MVVQHDAVSKGHGHTAPKRPPLTLLVCDAVKDDGVKYLKIL